MPSELRQIVFSNEETIDALAKHCRRLHKEQQNLSVKGCEIFSDPEIGVRLEIDCGDEAKPGRSDLGKDHTITLKPAFIGAALVRYCIDLKIPIPRVAVKSLQVIGSGLALNLTIKASESD